MADPDPVVEHLERQIGALRTAQRQAIHNLNSMAVQLDGLTAQLAAYQLAPTATPPTEETPTDGAPE